MSASLSAPILPPFPPAGAPVRRGRSVRAVLALMLREMASSYGKSFGGYFWAIAEPALGIALLTFIFMLALRTPSLGHNFPIFYASGFLPFFTYVTLQRKISASLRFTKGLTNYPDVTFADAILARFVLNLMTQIAVFYIVIAVIEASYETHTRHDYSQIILAMSMAGVLALGVGVLNCFLFFHIPMLDRFWIIVNRPLFILSGVLYVFEEIPRAYQGV
ncbi:MAG: ABC transporter permease, partial [Paracoccaceae bacterium]